MVHSLVIVESPAKAKTINKYLGKSFIVRSSVGHVRDLPTGGKPSDPKERAKEAAKTRKLSPAKKEAYKKKRSRDQLVRRMGIDPAKNWAASYEILPGKEKVVSELRKLAENAEFVYLATDLDREGEAIAWHLREIIGGDPARFKRVVFNEITRKAIEAAFENPGELDIDRVNAQQARRFLDRVVGFQVSPLLWAKVARGLSAGRVQSVAVRLIVDREREIRAFVPEEYWELFAHLDRPEVLQSQPDSRGYRFQVTRFQDKAFRPGNKADTDTALELLKKASIVIDKRDDKPTSTRPNAPFITSTLQQSASTRLGFSVKKTMMLAQRLYEAGYITYMRTDSTNLSGEAIGSCRDYILKKYGDKYLPEQANIYTSKEAAQEAHEAIRPSNVNTASASVENVDPDAVRLYELIWQRFVACQMTRAEYLSTSISANAGDYVLRIRGRILKFDGFTRVMQAQGKQDDDVQVPDLQVGENMQLIRLEPNQHFTKPVPRFGEASLVRELEKRGIGRPSTYASIISTIQDRGYVALNSRRFYAAKIGELVTDRLVENFNHLMDYGFTAEMEGGLDQVANGEVKWIKVLDDFYTDFTEKLEHAQDETGGMRPNEPTDTNIECPKCGRFMQIRTGSTGVFLGCSGYGLKPKERCTQTLNLIPGDEVVDIEQDEDAESRLLRTKHKCSVCKTPMDSYLVDENRKLHICGDNPECDGYEIESGEFRIKGYDGPLIECDKCGADMQLKSGRFGKYFGCTADQCTNTRKLLRSGEAAPPKADPVPMPELLCNKVDDFYILRDGAAGIFLAASKFPKHRETRAPLVSELLSHSNELDPKFKYLLDAPVADPDGNPAAYKYSRKEKKQFVSSEKDGKATGWRADYEKGKWIETLKKPTSKKNAVAKKKAVAKKNAVAK